jgi:hypothetical protein
MRRFGKPLIRSMAAGLVLSLAGAAWAGGTPLFTTAPSNDPIPRCIVEGGQTQGEELSVLRTGCDVLAFTSNYKHGHIQPCQDDPTIPCTEAGPDGNGFSCAEGERLWLCMGTGNQ